MAFNHIADRNYDARNPRTAVRHSSRLLSVALFWPSPDFWRFSNGRRNAQSPHFASFSRAPRQCCFTIHRRWTPLSHIVLGWCLSIAPTGSRIAVRGDQRLTPLLLSLVVLL
jgi:4-hydroxybenzoate polyprenyltransferase